LLVGEVLAAGLLVLVGGVGSRLRGATQDPDGGVAGHRVAGEARVDRGLLEIAREHPEHGDARLVARLHRGGGVGPDPSEEVGVGHGVPAGYLNVTRFVPSISAIRSSTLWMPSTCSMTIG